MGSFSNRKAKLQISISLNVRLVMSEKQVLINHALTIIPMPIRLTTVIIRWAKRLNRYVNYQCFILNTMEKVLTESISQLQRKSNIGLKVIRQLSSGKEATVYLVNQGYSLLALKVYKDHSIRSFKRNQEYDTIL